MTLRSRLTLLIGGALTLALLAFSVALYLALARTTLLLAQDALASEAVRLIGAAEFTLTRITEPPPDVGVPATYVQTLDASGAPVARSANLGDYVIPLSSEGVVAVSSGVPWVEIVPKVDKRLLVYSLPVRKGETVTGVLQVARSLADRDAALASLRMLLIGGALLTLLAAGGAGWLLAGATLRPIGRMTQAAAAIGRARDFAQRLPATAAADEVGALSATLNAMLAELESAHAQLARSLQFQRRFIADASHELRTPLTTVRGYLALLERDPPISAADARTALGATITETDRLIRLVNQLFLLARTDAGQLQYTPAPVELAPLLETLAAQTRVRAPERVIEGRVAPGLAALGDADAIAQVLVNLLENALVHTPAASRITLLAEAVDGRAAVSVIDTGPGIAADELARLFDRFYQADPSRAGAGAGLGLAIARAVAEAQGGTLTAESALGRGSRFTLSLPRAHLSS